MSKKMPIFLPTILRSDGSICFDMLPDDCKTTFIGITGPDGSGKTNLQNNIAEKLSNLGYTVITSKSPCDEHTVNFLNDAIRQNGYEDWYTEQLLCSFIDGVLSNYMTQLNGRCDFFICQRGPVDQYSCGITRSGKSYSEVYSIQNPEHLAKFDIYIHLNCSPDIAWHRICDDEEEKDRCKYPDHFKRQVVNTKQLYANITCGTQTELDFLRTSKHLYLDTGSLSIKQVYEHIYSLLKELLPDLQ